MLISYSLAFSALNGCLVATLIAPVVGIVSPPSEDNQSSFTLLYYPQRCSNNPPSRYKMPPRWYNAQPWWYSPQPWWHRSPPWWYGSQPWWYKSQPWWYNTKPGSPAVKCPPCAAVVQDTPPHSASQDRNPPEANAGVAAEQPGELK